VALLLFHKRFGHMILCSGIQPAALGRDRDLRRADPTKRRYAGKTWTAVLNEDDLPAGCRKLVEMEAFDLLVILNGASCKIIWNASRNPPQIEAMYLESIRRLSRQYSKIFRFT
jgi:hypothetical protein